jgi:hypothetical protein
MSRGIRDAGQEVNSYRREASLRFEQLCRLIGQPNSVLAETLRKKLGRETLSRHTLMAWRQGSQAVPMEAFLAAVELAGPDAIRLISLTF